MFLFFELYIFSRFILIPFPAWIIYSHRSMCPVQESGNSSHLVFTASLQVMRVLSQQTQNSSL